MRTAFPIFTVLLSLAVTPFARSQSLTINTLAGAPGQGNADGSGATARMSNPWGVASDAAGNLYVADTDNHTIRMITPGGAVITLAGTAGISGSTNGTGGNARFNQPQGVAVDNATNVYVADTGNYTIRKIAADGTVTTLAGLAGVSGTTDNTGNQARFYEPEGVAVSSDGSLIYVADTWNHTIRKITASDGSVTTLAGSAGNPGSANGNGPGATFNQPQGVAVDGAGNVYVGDTGNQMIRVITPGGAVTTLAGSAGNYGSANGTGSAQFWGPQGLAVDAFTNVYVADSVNNTIRKIAPGGLVSTLAGTAGTSGSADGTGAAARFWLPQSVAVDGSGNIYVADSANGTIRKIVGTVVTTLAGSASSGSADGTNTVARFYWPAGSAMDGSGSGYIADTGNSTIRKIVVGGLVSTLAGSAGITGSTDNTGGNARFNGPQGVTVDSSGNVYVADTGNHTIRKVISGGSVSTLAGSAGNNGLDDGTNTAARFNSPEGVAVDGSGNVYVADTWNHAIRKVTPGGTVTTVAGLRGSYGDIDSGGAGNGTNTARFYCPSGVAVDGSGNIYVADTRNHTIRKVTAGGVVSTLAGLAGSYGSTDGTNSSARFYLPQSIAVDASGNLLVVDSGNHTIRKITPSGTNWVVTTVAGLADVSGSTDGIGASAQFFYPSGIGVNSNGVICIADWGNNTARSVGFAVNSGPIIAGQPQNQTVNQGQNGVFSANVAGTAPLIYQWRFNGSDLPGANASSYTVTSSQATNAGSYSVVITNNYGSATSLSATLTVILPPAISLPPQDLTVDQGGNAPFSVTATGTALSYQWLFNSGAISSATVSTYTRTNIQPGDAGSYSVIVSNSAGSITSVAAVLTVHPVPTPPGISAQPQGKTASQGSNVTFTVTAFGSTPLAYQWLFQGTNLPGATASSYAVTSATTANAGSYAVIVTNDFGAITSSVVTLTVIAPPVISVQPAGRLASVSNTVAFSVTLSQGTSPAYQWRNNGSAISGATESSLTLSSISWNSAGSYTVIVTNSAGSVTSANAILIVEQAAFTYFDGFEGYATGSVDNNTSGGPNTGASNPWWGLSTTTPQGLVTNSSTGVSPHGGTKMLGATGSLHQDYINLLYRMNAGQTYYGNFMCDWWFYDRYGTGAGAASSQDYLAVAQYTPISTSSDASVFNTYNQRMSLGAYNGAGYNSLVYQARIVGSTAGDFGSGNSWYNTPTPRTIGWHHARIIVGIPNASSLAPVTMYIDNMTNAVVTSPTTGTTFGFNLIEMNHSMSTSGFGWYYDDFTFRVDNDPWIIEQPLNQTVSSGQTATFNTVAVGTAYQWQFNGANLGGATTSAYTVPSAAATNAGSYTCVITGTNGTITTSQAVLTVTAPPAIVTQPVSLSVLQSHDAAFNVTAAGSGPISYQWRFNNSALNGATDTSYSITNSQSTNTGSYTVVVTNIYGSVTSVVATLTVTNAPAAPGHFDSFQLLGGAVQFQMTGSPNTNYFLEYTSDFTNWNPLTTLSATNGVFQFSDPVTNNLRFYRLRPEP